MSSDDLKTMLLATTWFAWLWPVVALAVTAFVFRSRLREPLAFFALGALCCYGVSWVVAQVDWSRRLNLAATTSADTLAATLLSSAAVVLSLSIVLSIVPVTWLYRLLGQRESRQTPNNSLERTREG